MNNFKAFIISLLIHISLFATFLEYQMPKKEEKELIVLNMNMVNEITKIKKQTEKKQQTDTKKQKKQIEKKVEKKIEKKVVKKQVKKQIKETTPVKKILKPKKIVEKKSVETVEKKVENTFKEVKKSVKKEESIKRVKSGETYQEKYIKNNLADIIAAIKKYKNYPYLAKKRGMEGKVLIKCIITASGKIKNIQIIEKCNFDILNKNSIDILKLASKEFKAPKKDISLTIPFSYYLN